MRALTMILIFFSLPVWAGSVLFIDLNNAREEVAACARGVRDASPRNADGTPTDQVYVINRASMGQLRYHAYDPSKSITAADVDAYVRELEDAGVKIDSIVLSGHDGNGMYFGSQGELTADQLKWVLSPTRHRLTYDNAQMLIQWGCYTGSANACENIWGNYISPNINTQVGFTVKAPLSSNPANATLLQDVCQKRQEISTATTAQQYDQLLNNLAGINQFGVGICKPEGVCSRDYMRRDAAGNIIPGQSCLQTYEELHRRCSEFDPGEQELATYRHYLNADPGYENPPPDNHTFAYANGSVDVNPIRRYYNSLHLWRHCLETEDNPRGFEMESTSRAIRLIKFNEVKANLLKFHSAQVNDFNERLRAAGLGQFALDGLRTMSRAEVVARTRGAVVALEAGRDPALYNMAVQMDRLLRILQPRCIPFSWIDEDLSGYGSDCVASYGRTPPWPTSN